MLKELISHSIIRKLALPRFKQIFLIKAGQVIEEESLCASGRGASMEPFKMSQKPTLLGALVKMPQSGGKE